MFRYVPKRLPERFHRYANPRLCFQKSEGQLRPTRYPSETLQREALEKTGEVLPYSEEMMALDQREFYKRQTDRHIFDVNEICRWNKDHFELINMPSDTMLSEIRARITDDEEEAEFLRDMEEIRKAGERIRREYPDGKKHSAIPA